jgi:apolipoprotein N-acyltransferase
MTQVPGVRFQVLTAAAAVCSGLLLAAAFPPLERADAVWVGLLPLLIAVRFADGKSAFRLGFLAGAVFWLCSLSWLTRVTWPGMVVLALYCALYFGVFGWGCALWLRRFGTEGLVSNLGFMVHATALWVGLEFMRSHFLTGFPWNPLAVSQYRNPALIQLASIGGTHLVSALIVWVSAAVAVTILGYIDRRGKWMKRPHAELFFGLVAVVAAMFWGLREVREPTAEGTELRISLIQPNIPQDEKWDQAKYDLIYSRLGELSSAALMTGTPDLMVWPETALPDDVRTSEASSSLVIGIATSGTPLLVGSMDTVYGLDGRPTFYNTAFLFEEDGSLGQRYDKQHLVMFGEYVPLRHVLPFIKALTPIGESFDAGRTGTVFRLEQPEVAFGALICFEDAFAEVARAMVRNGARMLVNLTNDAWFDPSAGSRQHMAHGVFRCVENGVPMVRCANSGVSCAITAKGRITDELLAPDGDPRIAGFMNVGVVVQGDVAPTLYARMGDAFAWVCLGLAVALVALVRRSRPTGGQDAAAPSGA